MTTILNASSSAGLVAQADTSAILQLQTGNTAAMTISASQNVGVGTSSPSYPLDVLSNSSAIGVSIRGRSADNLSLYNFTSNNGATQYGYILGGPSEFRLAQNGANYITAYTNSAERMRIDSSGSVLIGTSDNNFINGIGLKIANSTSARLKLCDSDYGVGATDGFELTAAGTDSYIYNQENGFMAFGTNSSERMRIDSAGSLLLGSTAQAASGASKLLVKSSNPSTGYCADFLQSSANGGTYYFQSFWVGAGTQVGYISSNGSTTTYSTSSDYRLKENIAPMTGALAKVQALKPCTYTWKSDGSAGEGFIAHELQAVVPDCVSGEKDAVDEEGNIKPQGIDTSFLVATLTAAIQEQQALITQLQADVAALKAK